jgi:hypothetical protein
MVPALVEIGLLLEWCGGENGNRNYIEETTQATALE